MCVLYTLHHRIVLQRSGTLTVFLGSLPEEDIPGECTNYSVVILAAQELRLVLHRTVVVQFNYIVILTAQELCLVLYRTVWCSSTTAAKLLSIIRDTV